MKDTIASVFKKFSPVASSFIFNLHFLAWLAVPEVWKCVKCGLNADGVRETACCLVTLWGLVTLWLCGVAPTCPLALPINYRWNQVPRDQIVQTEHNFLQRASDKNKHP